MWESPPIEPEGKLEGDREPGRGVPGWSICPHGGAGGGVVSREVLGPHLPAGRWWVLQGGACC